MISCFVSYISWLRAAFSMPNVVMVACLITTRCKWYKFFFPCPSQALWKWNIFLVVLLWTLLLRFLFIFVVLVSYQFAYQVLKLSSFTMRVWSYFMWVQLFWQRDSLLKLGPLRCGKEEKASYCLECLFSLVEQVLLSFNLVPNFL